MRFNHPHIPSALRFLIIGGTCFFVGILLLYAGTDLAGLHYLTSLAMAMLVTNTLGWALNRLWTFESQDPLKLRQYGRYLLVALLSALASLAAMWVLVDGLGINYLVASVLLAVAAAAGNFIAHRSFSFSVRQPDGGA